jgi:hypothetical protein
MLFPVSNMSWAQKGVNVLEKNHKMILGNLRLNIHAVENEV